MNKKIIIMLLLIILSTYLSFAQEEEAITLNLRDCINMAIETDPSITKAEQNIIIGESQKTQTVSEFYPDVGLTGSYYRSNRGSATIDGNITAATNSTQSHDLALGITQRIFDSFRTWHRYKYSQLQIEKSGYSLEKEKQSLALEVTEAYFQTIKNKYLVELDGVLLEQSHQHLDKTIANFEAGISPRADIVSAEVNVTEGEVNLLEAENSLSIQMATLKNLTGLKRDVEIILDEELYELQSTLELDKAIVDAMNNRPDLKAVILQIEAQEKQIKLAELDRYPYLTVDLGYYSEITRDPSIPENYYAFNVQLSFPIFDGYETEARLEEAKANKVIYEAEKLETEKSISLEVEKAFYNLRTSLAKIELTSRQVEEGKTSLEISEGRYEAGVGPFQEVLDSQTAYARAMTDFLNARYDYQIALFSFKKAIGEELL